MYLCERMRGWLCECACVCGSVCVCVQKMNNMPLATDTVIPKYDHGHFRQSRQPKWLTPEVSILTTSRRVLVFRRFLFVWRLPWHDHHPKWFGLHRRICQSQPSAIWLRQALRNMRLLFMNSNSSMTDGIFKNWVFTVTLYDF